ncbi:hypothetical protein [Pseudomonas sp. P9_31]|uniref:hypothetical protein n=1 Tax=Pseudomonas sp. P9_31 TaxID=3043448 RepID=UPI002A36163F|nr:hypothetical protein [Pseudomonas sp. P9_31]WPN56684.1 hypothetical protein QMK51_21460 [Pseudomonas sp. P9_31]
MLRVFRKGLSLVGAVLAAYAGMFWYLSADTQEKLNSAVVTNVEAYKDLVSFSLYLNTQAAIFSAVAAACVAVAEFLSD